VIKDMNVKQMISGSLAMFALVALMTSCEQKPAAPAEIETKEEVKPELKIAYVLIDTLTSQYEYYKDAADNFQKKQANAEATINEKGRNFSAQVQEFQRKVQSNAITQQQYESEQARLQKLQQDIDGLQARLSNSLQEEYQKEMNALTDTIKNFIASYAKEKGYDFVLCKSSGIDNVLYGAPQYDVTDEVVKALNKRYAKSSEKKESATDEKKKK
jgi:outer membrane protein